jgi:hypothetical protein
MNIKMWLGILVALLVLPLVACNGVSATVQFRADEDYHYLTVNMTEQETQTLFEGIFAESEDLPVSNPVVDLRPGEIAISGEVPSGESGTVPVNLTVRASMQNSQPSIVVSSASFAGWEGTPEMFEEINADIAAGLAEAAQNEMEAQLTDIAINDTGLSFTLRAPREE